MLSNAGLQWAMALNSGGPAQSAASNAHTALKPLLPALLLGRKVARLLRNVLNLIAKQTALHRENLPKQRRPGPKPDKYMTQKNC